MSGKESYRETTDRDREILAIPEGYDSIQVTLSRFEPDHYGWRRETLKTAFIPIPDYLRETRPSVDIPCPDVVLDEMSQRGIDPMAFISFVGDVAVWK